MPTTSCCGLNQSGVFWKPRIQPYTPGTAHQLFQVRDTDDRVRVLLKNHAVYNELYRSVQTTQVPARQVLPPCAVGQEVLRGSRDRVAEYLNLDVTQRGFEGHRHRSRQVGSARVCPVPAAWSLLGSRGGKNKDWVPRDKSIATEPPLIFLSFMHEAYASPLEKNRRWANN